MHGDLGKVFHTADGEYFEAAIGQEVLDTSPHVPDNGSAERCEGVKGWPAKDVASEPVDLGEQSVRSKVR
jgi:hypothetical protein